MKKVNYGYNEAHPETETIKKVGRKSVPKFKSFEKSEAIKLLSIGMTQKDIAIKLSVTEKTVGNWAKECKQALTVEAETLTNLKARLLTMTKDNAPITDIKNLVSVIQQLETK